MEELNFKYYLILINLDSPMWLVGTILNKEAQGLSFSFPNLSQPTLNNYYATLHST